MFKEEGARGEAGAGLNETRQDETAERKTEKRNGCFLMVRFYIIPNAGLRAVGLKTIVDFAVFCCVNFKFVDQKALRSFSSVGR